MALVVGHKGASVYRCQVHGHAAHSALAPRGVNAIVYAACLITRLQQISGRLTQSERRHPGYDIKHTTLNVGVITGGLASNIVAAECEFRFDIRHLAWTSPESIVDELESFATAELLPQMRALAPESAIRFELVGEVPPLATAETSPLALHVARVLNTTTSPGYVGFGTEAGSFTAAGIPTVICGPGSIAQAHQPDEFITLEQLARCENFMHALIQASIPADARTDDRRAATGEQTCH
jgi:acetylornithine deacetylase